MSSQCFIGSASQISIADFHSPALVNQFHIVKSETELCVRGRYSGNTGDTKEGGGLGRGSRAEILTYSVSLDVGFLWFWMELL